MRVLVTGAAGFIGSHLCEALLKEGADVVGIDNFNDYYTPQFKWHNTARLRTMPRFTLLQADIRNQEAMTEIFNRFQPEGVAHLAAMAGVRNSVMNPSLYVDVNISGSQVLLELARTQAKPPIFVFASTSSAYGESSAIPFSESAPCITPLQPYAASKRAVELLAHSYHGLYGLNFTATRFFTVYGPRGRPDMMPMLLADSIRLGSQIPFYGDRMARDWTFVSDIVDGLLLALEKPLGYAILNLGRGAPAPLLDFIKAMEECAGKKANLRPAEKPESDVYVTYADTSEAKARLGYAPKVDFKDGVAAFWQWYTDRFSL